jgi:hypothetical protein
MGNGQWAISGKGVKAEKVFFEGVSRVGDCGGWSCDPWHVTVDVDSYQACMINMNDRRSNERRRKMGAKSNIGALPRLSALFCITASYITSSYTTA